MKRDQDAGSEPLRNPMRQALLVQMGATLLAMTALMLAPQWFSLLWVAACLQGVLAAALAWWWRMPRWWVLIELVFGPAAVAALALQLPPWIWLAAFVLMLLVFWRTDDSRVPLYMTNGVAASRVAQLLPAEPCEVIDLGCGDGSLLRQLALARPDCRFVGYEHAPLTWLWAWLLCRRLPHVSVRRGSFWDQSLQPYAVVYAFLSPAPMERLWHKARTELRPSAWLISNSFEVPGVKPRSVVRVSDKRQTLLYCYQPVPPA